MKKWVALLCCLLLCLSAAAHAESKRFISGEETELFHQDGVRMYLTGEYEDIGTNTFLGVAVENDTDLTIMITYKVNDESFSRGFAVAEMAPHSVTHDTLCFSGSIADALGVHLAFTVEDYDTWDAMFTAEADVDLTCYEPDKVFVPEIELVLFDQDGVKLYLTGAYDDGEGAALHAAAENGTGGAVSITGANGFAAQVLPGEPWSGTLNFDVPYADIAPAQFVFAVSGADGSALFEADAGVIRFHDGYAVLEVGSRGDDVTDLQQVLIGLGYLDGSADGIYGKMTAAAVSAFQAAEGLSETGIADVVTQATLFAK